MWTQLVGQGVTVETKTVNIKKLQVATKENYNKQIHVTTKNKDCEEHLHYFGKRKLLQKGL